MKRRPEPELMDSEAQTRAYAEADFEESNSLFTEKFQEYFNHTPPAGTMADLGCGPGDISVRMANRYPGWNITGLDAGPNMLKLAQERLACAVVCMAGAQASLDQTLEYVKEREAFGRPIGSFQNSRFKMAEMKTEITIGNAFVDGLVMKHLKGEVTVEEACMAKYWTSDLLNRVADECVQLHGGYGYMDEYPVCRTYVDARIQRIYAGTNEIMKEVIGRGMGL